MPDLKVGRFMPVAINHTTLFFCRQRTKLLARTEAKFRTYLSSVKISLKSPLFTLPYFYEIKMPPAKSVSKTLSHIQSTVKYIF